MANPGGIVTLQLGEYANFVGSHYWNIQDETLGHLTSPEWSPAAQEVLAGKLFTHSQELRARLVIADFKGSQGGVRLQANEAGLTDTTIVSLDTWAGQVDVIKADTVPQSSFYSLLANEEPESSDEDDDQDDDEQTYERKAAQREAHAAAMDTTRDDDEAPEDGPMEVAAAELDSGSGPQYFTDYLKIVLHPKTVVEIPDLGYQQGRFSGFGDLHDMGSELVDVLEGMSDRTRHFAEGCDVLEGLQLFADDCSMWGGATVKLSEELKDDYPKQPMLLFSTRPYKATDDDTELKGLYASRAQLNSALAMGHLSQDCNLYVPIDTPLAPRPGCDLTKQFHTAALQAVAIDSSTLCYRINSAYSRPTLNCTGPPSQGATSMAGLATLLSVPAANFAAIGAAWPASEVTGEAMPSGSIDKRMSARERRLAGISDAPAAPCTVAYTGLTWYSANHHHRKGILAESVTLRGGRCAGETLSCSTAMTRLERSLQHEGIRAVRHLCTAAMPLPIPLPFPNLFQPGVSKWGDQPLAVSGDGRVKETSQVSDAQDSSSKLPRISEDSSDVHATLAEVRKHSAPRTCSVLTRLASTSAFEGILKSSAKSLQQSWYDSKSRDDLRRWNYGQEDVLDLREHLLNSMRKYQQYDGEEDSDMDDEMHDE